jgi:hypothetical protein
MFMPADSFKHEPGHTLFDSSQPTPQHSLRRGLGEQPQDAGVVEEQVLLHISLWRTDCLEM